MSGARRFHVASILWLLPLMASVRPASACRCGDPPVCEAFWAADAVFIGVADVIDREEQRTRFRVEEAFRGARRDEIIEVLSYGVCWSCEYGFQHANRYLVFATKRPTGEWRAGLCSRTKPFEKASNDIAFARFIVGETKRQGRVHGTAWISSEGPLLDEATVNLKVLATPLRNRQTIVVSLNSIACRQDNIAFQSSRRLVSIGRQPISV